MFTYKKIILIGILVLFTFSPLISQKNQTCETCHVDSKYTKKHNHIKISSDLINNTVHRKFSCVDCHYEGFNDYPHKKALSTIKCIDCHKKEKVEYENSSHYLARLKGNIEAPDCVDCHNKHDIQNPRKSQYGLRVMETCGKCHADKAFNSKFKLKKMIVSSYISSYHGKMYNLGFKGENYATCVSCHDNHSILGADNPTSRTFKGNLVKTCSECHKEANEDFVSYLSHYAPEDYDNKTLDIVHSLMSILLYSVMIFFGLHTLLWFIRSVYDRKKFGYDPKPAESVKYYLRFTVVCRIAHILLASSFLILAGTGLPLKFTESKLSIWIANNIIGFHEAAVLHRIAAFVMIFVFLFHVLRLLHKIIIKREKGMLWGRESIVPNFQDVKDLFGNIAYFLFLKKKQPKFDRWAYWEKFDYFAVFWGMFIIGFSGLTLMLPVLFSKVFPGWFINLFHIIHSEEALLATAFIFIVHFFNTHLRPHAFPLDDSIFTGRVSEERFKEERPLEYERRLKDGTLSSLETKRMSPVKTGFLRIFGSILLFIGLFLLLVIITGVF